MNTPEDFRGLVARAQEGDAAAVDALLETIRPWLWEAARGFSDPEQPDESTADLAQAAWLQAWQALQQYRGADDGDGEAAAFRAWVQQIVRRLGMNAVRDRKAMRRRPPSPLQRLDEPVGRLTVDWERPHPPADDPSPSSRIAADERDDRVREALERLPDDLDRRIVHLRFVEGVSLREAADRAGVNREDARRRFHAALRILERELEGL